MRARVVVLILFLMAVSCALLFFTRRNPSIAASDLPRATADTVSQTSVAGESRPPTEVPSQAALEPAELSVGRIPHGASLQLRVVVKGTEDPIPGANVRVSTSDRPTASPGDKLFRTGSNGVVDIPLPDNDPAQFIVRIEHDGFAGWWSAWDVAKGEKVPAQHTVTLERATLIGGYVVDESARPVAGASVSIGRIWRGNETIDRSNHRPEISATTIKTDADGKWTHHKIPDELLQHIQITVSHPDYAETRKWVDADSVPDLRSLRWIATLQHGERVVGVILDTNQFPVVGANVSFGMRFSASRKETTSDASGRYELTNLSLDPISRENMVIAMAKGFAPASQPLTGRNAKGELNFILQAGAVIRGRVQNRQGEPLENVTVSRERESITDDDGIVWSGKTDTEGRFEWDGAPSRPQRFYFGVSGYAQLRNKVLPPGPTEHLIVLEKRRVLKGSLRDATTGNAIPEFFVLPARGTPQRLSRYSLSSEAEFKNGRFELELSEAEHNMARIRAPGYLTAIFPIPDQGSFDATLKPSRTLEGIVVDTAGRPLERAEVAAIDPNAQGYAMLGKGRFTPDRITFDHTATDQNGKFKLDLSVAAQSIVAIHADGGFAEVGIDDFDRAKELRLQPWGRLEGTLLSNGQALQNQEVALHNLGSGSQAFNTDLGVFKATTDQNGKFTFEFVPPRPLTLSRLIPIDEHSSRFSDKTNLTVAPGAITFFEFMVP